MSSSSASPSLAAPNGDAGAGENTSKPLHEHAATDWNCLPVGPTHTATVSETEGSRTPMKNREKASQVTLGLVGDALDMLLAPGDVLVVKGRGRLMEIGTAGGFMGHVLVVTAPPRFVSPESPAAEPLQAAWPKEAAQLWMVPTVESTRHEQGLHQAETVLYVHRSSGRLCLHGELGRYELVVQDSPETIEVWQSPAELRAQLRPDLMQEVVSNMKTQEADWSAGTAFRALVTSAKLTASAGSAQVLEDIRDCWARAPICTSVVVNFWQRYLCKLAHSAIVDKGTLVDPAELVLRWMPVKGDRILPGELFRTLEDIGWVVLPLVPKVFQPLAVKNVDLPKGEVPFYQVGERVEYWSERHNKWITAVVRKQHIDAHGKVLGYDLDVKLCAEVNKIRAPENLDGSPIRRDDIDQGLGLGKNPQELCAAVTQALNEGWLSTTDVVDAIKASNVGEVMLRFAGS